MSHHRSANQIENEAAYRAAIQTRIKANAVIGRRRRFLAIPANAAAIALLEAEHDRHANRAYDENGNLPREGRMPDFRMSIYLQFLDRGELSERQVTVVFESYAKDEERKAEFAAKRAVEASTSKHVASVGSRGNFTLILERLSGYDSQFGYVTIHTFKDPDGNVVVYKGRLLSIALPRGTYGDLEDVRKGSTYSVTGTVKAHDEYKGLKQTVISRPIVNGRVG